MSPNEFKGYDKPHFDSRVKNVLQIDNIFKILARGATVLTVSVILALVFSAVTRAAATTNNLFLVPVVLPTPKGAVVLQPQTGDGYETLNKTVQNKGDYNSGGVYIAPKYDAFAKGSANQPVKLEQEIVKNVDWVDFQVRNNLAGGVDQFVGTTKTIFTFTGDVTSKDYRNGELEYRWDFENDSQVDSYFSKVKSISHVYPLPGDYQVKLEVLDSKGQVSWAVKSIHIAANDAPTAYFMVNKTTAPKNSVFRFDTSYSSDNQYGKASLAYRFDWEGDGKFDTNFQNKTIWSHLFRDEGNYRVIMEARDPEGLTAKAALVLNVLDDTGPEARLSVEKIGDFRYKFDGSQSSDDFTPIRALKFRWDFNYSGPDDIVFDSNWSFSPKYNGFYRLGGSKTVRLQVMDEQGFIAETYAQIEVAWPENYLNMAVNVLGA
jgi:hypothetical protein